jgi:hypothetical protein
LKSLVIHFVSLPIYVNVEIYKLNAKKKENNTTKQVLYNSKYDTAGTHKLIPAKNKTRLDRKDTPKIKWAKVT